MRLPLESRSQRFSAGVMERFKPGSLSEDASSKLGRSTREHRSAPQLTTYLEMPTFPKNTVLLAIDPTSRGFAFVVLEAPAFLVDWGSKSVRARSGGVARRVDALLSRYQPDVLVLEDIAADGARRRKRAR